MQYTKKQRKEIYLKALELVAKADFNESSPETPEQYERYICHAISKVCEINYKQVINYFPEVYSFRNFQLATDLWLQDYDSITDEYHFEPDTKNGNELRQLVLIFAAELCDDKNFK